MRKESRYYTIYATTILIVTALISFWLLNDGITGKFIILGHVEKESEMPRFKFHCTRTNYSSIPVNILIPNCETIFDGLTVKIPATNISINSHGLRDYEYSIEKPTNTFRIIALGDSITWGHGVELEDTYVKTLERMLNNKTEDNRKYEVLNFGVPGHNAIEKVEILKGKGMEFNPDMVIFQYTEDDYHNRTELYEVYRGLAKEYIEKNSISNQSEIPDRDRNRLYDAAYEKYQKELNKKMESNPEEVWQNVENPLLELNNTTDDMEIDVIILIAHPIGKFNVYLERISDNFGWEVIHADEIIHKYGWEKTSVHEKDNHPNEFTHRLMAERIYRKITV